MSRPIIRRVEARYPWLIIATETPDPRVFDLDVIRRDPDDAWCWIGTIKPDKEAEALGLHLPPFYVCSLTRSDRPTANGLPYRVLLGYQTDNADAAVDHFFETLRLSVIREIDEALDRMRRLA